MQKKASALSTISWVIGWLEWFFKSIPTLRRARTLFWLAGYPGKPDTPAELTVRDFKGSSCASRAWRKRASAIGERHVLAVQTNTISFWEIGIPYKSLD